MSNKAVVNLVGILLLYVLCWAAIQVVRPGWIGPSGLFGQRVLLLNFQQTANYILAASLGCMLVWFASAEWVLRPWGDLRNFYLVWAVLLLVDAAVTLFYALEHPFWRLVLSASGHGNALLIDLLLGVGSFYLGSVLFSPVNAKYLIWPSKHLLNRS